MLKKYELIKLFTRLIALCAVSCLFLNRISLADSPQISANAYESPDIAFEMKFGDQPEIVLPCGDHIHMCGLDYKSYPHHKIGTVVSAIASRSGSGWIIKETGVLCVYRMGRELFIDLFIWKTQSCKFCLIKLNDSCVTPASVETDTKVWDTCGTPFAVRNFRFPGFDFERHSFYGLVNLEEPDYQLFCNTVCIYP